VIVLIKDLWFDLLPSLLLMVDEFGIRDGLDLVFNVRDYTVIKTLKTSFVDGVRVADSTAWWFYEFTTVNNANVV
jgi:hypothetical protein